MILCWDVFGELEGMIIQVLKHSPGPSMLMERPFLHRFREQCIARRSQEGCDDSEAFWSLKRTSLEVVSSVRWQLPCWRHQSIDSGFTITSGTFLRIGRHDQFCGL